MGDLSNFKVQCNEIASSNCEVDFSSFNQELTCININSQTTFSSKNSTSISISFDSEGMCLKFPKYKSSTQTYDMRLTKSDVLQVFAYYDEYACTFISIVTSAKLVEDVEKNLKTFKIKSPYYNPDIEWSKQLKISFLLQNVSEDILKVLSSLYGEEKVKSIQKNEAYSLLKSSSVKNLDSPEPLTSRSLVYPSVGGIQVKCEDIAQLAHGKPLNDTIIEFYLKYIYYEKLSPNLQTKTHIFSPFFYECLQRVVKTALNGTGLKAFDRIYTWIKNVDIFSKDFIFIPINKSQHWYVVAVCFIGTICKKTEEIVLDDDSTETKETPDSTSDLKNNLRKTRKQNETLQLDRNKPFVCFFDSSDDSLRFNKEKTEVANIVKAFFRILWENKNPDKPCQWDKLDFFKPRCPQQRNKYDCGIFLLQYVESFFEIPISGFQDPFFDMRNWFPTSLVKGKRTYIKNLISKLKEKQKGASIPPIENSHSVDHMEIAD